MTFIRRARLGTGFSERTVVEYLLEGASSPDIIGVLRRAASRRKFDVILAELDQQFASLRSSNRDDPYEDGSDPDYALQILKFVDLTRSAVGEGNADQAARWAFQLGQLVREYDLKHQFERAALTGEKNLKGLDENRPRLNQARHRDATQRHARWRALADDIRQTHPDSNDSEIARRIMKRLGVQESHRTVRRAIQKKVGHAG